MPLARNAERSRYELALPEGLALAVYREEPGAVVITHTEVPVAARGRGVGAELVRAVLDDIAARGLQVVPRCAFVARFIAAHPEFQALVRGAVPP